jgi:hypothetical protein
MEKVLAEVSEGAGQGGQVAATGPVALTRVLERESGVTLFGSQTFYPFDHWDISLGEVVDRPSPAEAYAIHHWDATWQDADNLLKRKRRLRRQLRDAKERERKALARLATIESTRWWRLRTRTLAVLTRFPVPGQKRDGEPQDRP